MAAATIIKATARFEELPPKQKPTIRITNNNGELPRTGSINSTGRDNPFRPESVIYKSADPIVDFYKFGPNQSRAQSPTESQLLLAGQAANKTNKRDELRERKSLWHRLCCCRCFTCCCRRKQAAATTRDDLVQDTQTSPKLTSAKSQQLKDEQTETQKLRRPTKALERNEPNSESNSMNRAAAAAAEQPDNEAAAAASSAPPNKCSDEPQSAKPNNKRSCVVS